MQRAPEDCMTMAELRAEIDRLDKELVDLLARRATYIDRAAEIKETIGLPARIEARVEEVVANVLTHVAKTDLPADLIESFWRGLIEWSIAREDRKLSASPTKG